MSVVPTGQPDPDRRKALQLYGLFGATLILFLVPMLSVAIISIVLVSVLLFIAGRMNKKSPANSLAQNHGQYIFRTVWIGSFFAAITVVLSSIYLVDKMDHSALQGCSDALINSASAAEGATPAELYPMLEPCMDGFVKSNFNVLIVSSLIAAAPPYIYFVARFIRGLSRAHGGYRIAKPKAWF